MLPIADEWHAQPSAGGLLLWPVDQAASVCQVRYWESRPLRPLHAQARECLGRDPDFVLQAASPVFRFQTHEGEYGAGLIVDGVHRQGLPSAAARGPLGRPQRRILCSVFAEHFCTWLEATVDDPARYPELGDRVIRLAASDRLGLGVRRRRFVFTPPAGWRLHAVGSTARLFHPDYPRRRLALAVPAAWPRGEDTPGLDAWLAEQDRGDGLSPEPTAEYQIVARATARGLQGFLREGFVLDRRDGSRRQRLAYYLRDERYLYGLRLVASLDETHTLLVSTLTALADSIEPLPGGQAAGSTANSAPSGPASPTPVPGGLMTHWSG